MKYSITSNFINLLMSWEKYGFYSIWKNWILNPSWIGKALNKNIDYIFDVLMLKQDVKWKFFNYKFTYKTMISRRTRG